jgi:hypothetical protein
LTGSGVGKKLRQIEGLTDWPRSICAAEFREVSDMRTARQLSIVALTILFAAVALVAGERAIAVVIAPNSGNAAPLSPRETSIVTQPAPSSPWPAPTRRDPERAEHEKTFAWLLLLLKEHRGAR